MWWSKGRGFRTAVAVFRGGGEKLWVVPCPALGAVFDGEARQAFVVVGGWVVGNPA